jgi:hypothetical protein
MQVQGPKEQGTLYECSEAFMELKEVFMVGLGADLFEAAAMNAAIAHTMSSAPYAKKVYEFDALT